MERERESERVEKGPVLSLAAADAVAATAYVLLLDLA